MINQPDYTENKKNNIRDIVISKALLMAASSYRSDTDSFKEVENIAQEIIEFILDRESEAEFNIGKWLSAAMSDDDVCPEMKQDIVNWFTFIGNRHK